MAPNSDSRQCRCCLLARCCPIQGLTTELCRYEDHMSLTRAWTAGSRYSRLRRAIYIAKSYTQRRKRETGKHCRRVRSCTSLTMPGHLALPVLGLAPTITPLGDVVASSSPTLAVVLAAVFGLPAALWAYKVGCFAYSCLNNIS